LAPAPVVENLLDREPITLRAEPFGLEIDPLTTRGMEIDDPVDAQSSGMGVVDPKCAFEEGRYQRDLERFRIGRDDDRAGQA